MRLAGYQLPHIIEQRSFDCLVSVLADRAYAYIIEFLGGPVADFGDKHRIAILDRCQNTGHRRLLGVLAQAIMRDLPGLQKLAAVWESRVNTKLLGVSEMLANCQAFLASNRQ